MQPDPCPFCGSESQLLATKDGSGWWYGECTKCYARQLASDTKEAATEAWNNRMTRIPKSGPDSGLKRESTEDAGA